MAYSVLALSLAICLSTWLVFARGGSPSAVSDTVFVCGPLLILGIYLFLVSRKDGLRDNTGLRVPLRVGLLYAWLPNLLILGALSFHFCLKIVKAETYRYDDLAAYIFVLIGWILSTLGGLAGVADTRTARNKAEGKRE